MPFLRNGIKYPLTPSTKMQSLRDYWHKPLVIFLIFKALCWFLFWHHLQRWSPCGTFDTSPWSSFWFSKPYVDFYFGTIYKDAAPAGLLTQALSWGVPTPRRRVGPCFFPFGSRFFGVSGPLMIARCLEKTGWSLKKQNTCLHFYNRPSTFVAINPRHMITHPLSE